MTNKMFGKSGIPVLRKKPAASVSLREALGRAAIDIPEFLTSEDIDPAALEIGLAIKRARMREGLTQVQLAQRADITQSAISDIERGKGKDGPSFRTIKTLADALGVSLSLGPREDPSNSLYRAWLETLDRDTDLDLIDEKTSAMECVPFVRSLLEPSEFENLLARARALINNDIASGSLCAFWRLPARGHASVLFPGPTVVVTYNGAGELTALRQKSDCYVVVKSDETVGVANTGDRPLSVLTLPVTPELATA